MQTVDPKTMTLGPKSFLPALPFAANPRFFSGSGDYDLLCVTDLSLYGYRLGQGDTPGSGETLLSWLNCDMDGSGLLTVTLADLRDQGKSIDEVYAWALENRLHVHHWFYSSDLTFYVKGGRVTKAAGWFGTVLKICPVLNMDNLGRLIPRFKVRGKQKALQELLHQMEQHADGGAD